MIILRIFKKVLAIIVLAITLITLTPGDYHAQEDDIPGMFSDVIDENE